MNTIQKQIEELLNSNEPTKKLKEFINQLNK